MIEHLGNLCRFILEPTRIMLGETIVITSSYRCRRLNRAVGGRGKSQHLTGNAADLHIRNHDYALRLWQIITNTREDEEDENGSSSSNSSSNLSSEISSNLSSNSFLGLHNKVRAQARRSPIQNTNIQNTINIGTGVPIKSTTINTSFENVVKRILMTPIACLRPNKSERGTWAYALNNKNKKNKRHYVASQHKYLTTKMIALCNG